MLTRRTMLAATSSLLLLTRPLAGPLAAQSFLGDDGLYHQPWFLDSFLELKDDLDDANAKGKRLAIFWELKGCPYCQETHFKNFDRPDIAKYIRENFEILQLNMLGSRIVTDFDGSKLSEKQMAKKYGVRFSPTIMFLGEDGAAMAKLDARKRPVAVARGYLKPPHFLAMFRFVRSHAYQTMSFRKFLKSRKSS